MPPNKKQRLGNRFAVKRRNILDDSYHLSTNRIHCLEEPHRIGARGVLYGEMYSRMQVACHFHFLYHYVYHYLVRVGGVLGGCKE